MKKIILLMIVCTVAIISLSCKSKTPDTNGFECEFDNETMTASVMGYTGNEDVITIPKLIGDYTVTSIGRNAFKEMYDVSKILIPETVTSIEASAFELCVSLEEIILPSSLQKLGNTAFASCRSLKKITIPANVSSIGLCVFTGCTSLETIKVDENNISYSSDKYGVLLDKNQTTVIQFPLGSQHLNYEMPETVTKILSYAFEKTQYLEAVTFSPKLKIIESYAFQASSIREAIFFDGLEEIGSFCFNESKLITLELGNTVKKLGDSAFSWCVSLGNVTIPAPLESIGTSAFYMCTSVSEYKVDKDNKAFLSDENGVLFDKSMTYLMYYPIASTATEYTIPYGVETISARAFSPSLNLKIVTVPDSVETISEQAFAYCTNLNNIVYEGSQPKNIAENAFEK